LAVSLGIGVVAVVMICDWKQRRVDAYLDVCCCLVGSLLSFAPHECRAWVVVEYKLYHKLLLEKTKFCQIGRTQSIGTSIIKDFWCYGSTLQCIMIQVIDS
jgi:hypothetical protein